MLDSTRSNLLALNRNKPIHQQQQQLHQQQQQLQSNMSKLLHRNLEAKLAALDGKFYEKV